MDEILRFKKEVAANIAAQGKDEKLKKAAADFLNFSIRSRYSYNFTWLGRPVIQYPQDLVAIQEIIYHVQPDLIIETGIAHGGSLVFHASICELIGKGEVLGIDIDIREHNKQEILKHRMSKRISMIQGSSVDDDIVDRVKKFSKKFSKVLVILDSNHTHDHVFKELLAYTPLVSKGSYLVVFDTIVEKLPRGVLPGRKRPWDIGNNPMTAVKEFLKTNSDFIINSDIDNKVLISVAPGGYLKRVK